MYHYRDAVNSVGQSVALFENSSNQLTENALESVSLVPYIDIPIIQFSECSF